MYDIGSEAIPFIETTRDFKPGVPHGERPVETHRLRQFCTVVETANLRKAAALLGISHSGLSKSLRKLEDEVGLELFVQSGRGLLITDEGRHLFERCARFFDEEERVLGKSERRPQSVVRLGSFEVFTWQFMGVLLEKHLPGVGVEVHELTPGRLEEALITERVDLGITYEPIPRAGVDHVRVTHAEMGAYRCVGAFEGVPVADVPFVAPVSPIEGATSGVRGSDAWPDQRLHRHVPYRVDLMSTGIELVHRRLCAIFIPRFVAQLHNEATRTELRLVQIELPFPSVKRGVYLVKRESTPESKAVRIVAKALRQVCAHQG